MDCISFKLTKMLTNHTTAKRHHKISSPTKYSTNFSSNGSLVENPSKGGGILIADYDRVLYLDYFL